MKFKAERCEARSPGGVTAEGRLPRKGTRCGNYKGHDGDHTVLIPTAAPWWPRKTFVRPIGARREFKKR